MRFGVICIALLRTVTNKLGGFDCDGVTRLGWESNLIRPSVQVNKGLATSLLVYLVQALATCKGSAACQLIETMESIVPYPFLITQVFHVQHHIASNLSITLLKLSCSASQQP